MPAEPTEVKKPDYRELGAVGTRIFAGLISEETVPALQGQQAFKSYQGMRFDATCSSLYKAIELPIRSAEWRVAPASDKPDATTQADFVHDVLWDFGTQSFDDVCRLALEMLPFGFSALEILWQYISEGPWKGKVGWSELAYRSQASKWRWNLDWVNGRRQLVSMTQLAPPFYEAKDIPRNKLLLWVHDQEGHNYDGWSAFRPAYKDYWIRDQLYRIRSIGLERAFMGVPVAKIPAEFSDELKGVAKQVVESLRVDEQAGVVIPEELTLEILFNHLQAQGMDNAVLYHNRQILLSQLAQFLDLGSGQAGAYSLSSDHSELFLQAISSRANYFAEQLNLQPGVASLVRLNFPNVDVSELPRVEHGDIGQRALDKLGRTLQALGQFGFLTPDDPTEDRLREMLSLPQREDTIDDRALFDLIQEVFPVDPVFGRAHSGARLPSPLAVQQLTAQAKGAQGGQQPAPGPGDQSQPRGKAKAAPAGGGGGGEFAEVSDAHARLADLLARRRWHRVSGRPTDEHRRSMAATEQFTEALDEFHTSVSYHRRNRPLRPSERQARERRPYQVKAAEARQRLPGETLIPTRRVELALKRKMRIRQALLPRVRVGGE